MTALSDPQNFGARPASDQHYYGATRTGRGRWARLPGVGVLWTDDRDALQLARIATADQNAAYALRVRLHEYAAANVPASIAFDAVASERAAVVELGDLASF